MIVFRLSKAPYQFDLSGKGAEIYGGRWNEKGVAVLYTAENRALCLAECLVHVPLGKRPKDFWLISIQVPDDATFREPFPEMGPNSPLLSPFVKKMGGRLVLEQKGLGLWVPSVVVPH